MLKHFNLSKQGSFQHRLDNYKKLAEKQMDSSISDKINLVRKAVRFVHYLFWVVKPLVKQWHDCGNKHLRELLEK
jgi:hypothetical protein